MPRRDDHCLVVGWRQCGAALLGRLKETLSAAHCPRAPPGGMKPSCGTHQTSARCAPALVVASARCEPAVGVDVRFLRSVRDIPNPVRNDLANMGLNSDPQQQKVWAVVGLGRISGGARAA